MILWPGYMGNSFWRSKVRVRNLGFLQENQEYNGFTHPMHAQFKLIKIKYARIDLEATNKLIHFLCKIKNSKFVCCVLTAWLLSETVFIFKYHILQNITTYRFCACHPYSLFDQTLDEVSACSWNASMVELSLEREWEGTTLWRKHNCYSFLWNIGIHE